MDSAKAIFRNQCGDDDGLASIAEMKTGFYGRNRHQHPFVSRPLQRKPSFRNVSWGSSSFVSSPRSPGNMRSFFATGRFFEEPQKSHFLDSCFLCRSNGAQLGWRQTGSSNRCNHRNRLAGNGFSGTEPEGITAGNSACTAEEEESPCRSSSSSQMWSSANSSGFVGGRRRLFLGGWDTSSFLISLSPSL